MGASAVGGKSRMRTLDMVYISLFSALMMVGANITSLLPFMVVGGVPITLQAFLRSWRGLFSAGVLELFQWVYMH